VLNALQLVSPIVLNVTITALLIFGRMLQSPSVGIVVLPVNILVQYRHSSVSLVMLLVLNVILPQLIVHSANSLLPI
jgi:hypothetical protein